jgi:hypothetical protein
MRRTRIRGLIEKTGLVSAVISLTAAAASTTTTDSYWSLAKLMAGLDGTRVALHGRRIPVEADLTLCSGRGKPVVRRRQRRWKQFDCTQTTTNANGHDLEFHVRVLDQSHLAISNAHYASR